MITPHDVSAGQLIDLVLHEARLLDARDYDTWNRLFTDDAYYWVPLHRVTRVTIEAPSDARDLVWLPAQFQWSNGGEAMGLIPVRYPGSEQSDDAAIRLARKTEWREIGPDAYAGLGQRVLTTDGPEIGLLDLRELRLDATS